MHPRKVTVWAGFTSKFILPLAFVEGTETVNQSVYLRILRDTVLPSLPHPEQYMFMQDGATAHTVNAVLDFLKTVFGDNLISRRSFYPWPARSPDLNPCDYFLWGYLKGKVFRSNPQTIEELKNNISTEMAAITSDLLGRSVDSLFDRLLLALGENGGHIDTLAVLLLFWQAAS